VKPHLHVFKLLTERLKSLGFTRRGTSWWEIRRDGIWQRIHVHKFTFADSFRVHTAIHVAGIEDEARWFNGPNSHDGWFEEKNFGISIRRYDFHFHDSAESQVACANQLADYIERCVIPWFNKWSDANTLSSSRNSPLKEAARNHLKNSFSVPLGGP
jgi:hypothetical protein